MAFVDMPQTVEKVMDRLFAPKFDVTLEEIEDALNHLNHIQDTIINKDERGKLLQSLIAEIFEEAEPADDFRQVILKNHHLSGSMKPDFADSLVTLVKEVKENKKNPLLCQPLTSDSITDLSNSPRNENKRIFIPNCLDNKSVNRRDVKDINTLEQAVMTSFPRATKYREVQGRRCRKHTVLVPGCSEFPLSRMMHQQEGMDVVCNNSQYLDEDCCTAVCGRAGSVNSSNVTRRMNSEQEGASHMKPKRQLNKGVLLQKVSTNCIMVGVKDKTNRFILPKPKSCGQVDKNNVDIVTATSKGVKTKSQTRKRNGIDVMALCGGCKMGKVFSGNPRFHRNKVININKRNACRAGSSDLNSFEGTGNVASTGQLKEAGQCQNDPVMSPTLQNYGQQAKQGFRETERLEPNCLKMGEEISSPCRSRLGPCFQNGIALDDRVKFDSSTLASNAENSMQLLLKPPGWVGNNKTTMGAEEQPLVDDEEEEEQGMLVIDEDPCVEVGSDESGSTVQEGTFYVTTDEGIIDGASHWNDQSWMPFVQDQSNYRDYPKVKSSYCKQANNSRKKVQEKCLELQRQIFQSSLVSESLPWCSTYKVGSTSTSFNAEVDFIKTNLQGNTSNASSPDASSSADSLSLSQGPDGGTPKLPEYSFLFNLLKCHDDTEDEDHLIKFSWKKVLPKKKGKIRRSRRTRRAKVAYES